MVLSPKNVRFQAQMFYLHFFRVEILECINGFVFPWRTWLQRVSYSNFDLNVMFVT